MIESRIKELTKLAKQHADMNMQAAPNLSELVEALPPEMIAQAKQLEKGIKTAIASQNPDRIRAQFNIISQFAKNGVRNNKP